MRARARACMCPRTQARAYTGKNAHTHLYRYVVGLDKIASCSAAVDVMKEELIALQPVLVVKTKEVEDLIVVLDKEKADAAVVKESTAKEEAIASEEAEKVGAEKASCEADLAEAIPALNAAISALNSLTKGDITEMKGMKNPPKLVKLVMEGVCIMLEVKPEKVSAAQARNLPHADAHVLLSKLMCHAAAGSSRGRQGKS